MNKWIVTIMPVSVLILMGAGCYDTSGGDAVVQEPELAVALEGRSGLAHETYGTSFYVDPVVRKEYKEKVEQKRLELEGRFEDLHKAFHEQEKIAERHLAFFNSKAQEDQSNFETQVAFQDSVDADLHDWQEKLLYELLDMDQVFDDLFAVAKTDEKNHDVGVIIDAASVPTEAESVVEL